MCEFVGVIGVICFDDMLLFGLVFLMVLVIVMGNCVVFSVFEVFFLVVLDFYQILEIFDVFVGVVNILIGFYVDFVGLMVDYLNLDVIWSFFFLEFFGIIEVKSVGNFKCIWVNNGKDCDWFGDVGEGCEFFEVVIEVKNIWVFYGEQIFVLFCLKYLFKSGYWSGFLIVCCVYIGVQVLQKW